MTREPTEMELRVAEAIEGALDNNVVMFYGSPSLLRPVDVARAAIHAMRDPTPKMIGAEFVYKNCHMCGGASEQYPRMIDAASPPEE